MVQTNLGCDYLSTMLKYCMKYHPRHLHRKNTLKMFKEWHEVLWHVFSKFLKVTGAFGRFTDYGDIWIIWSYWNHSCMNQTATLKVSGFCVNKLEDYCNLHLTPIIAMHQSIQIFMFKVLWANKLVLYPFPSRRHKCVCVCHFK